MDVVKPTDYDKKWTSEEWEAWAYHVGLKLDWFSSPFGVDNRKRIEDAIIAFKRQNTAPTPTPELREAIDESRNLKRDQFELALDHFKKTVPAYADYVQLSGEDIYFRYDTPDRTGKENFTEYCDISGDLSEYGYVLDDVCIEHDCISGYIITSKESFDKRTLEVTFK